jgi:hypothetical protein
LTLVTVPVFDVKPEGLAAGYAPSEVNAAAAEVAPVPPFATASVPASVIVPLVVTGPPDVVRPVVPPLTSMLVTEPVPLAGEEIVKLGYVPVTVVAPEPVRATT